MVMRRLGAVAMGMMLVASSCGGSSDGGGGSDDDGEGDVASALASLAVIDTNVKVNESKGSEGQDLGVGDTVVTNPEGFGEVNYFDGSLTRVSKGAEFTLTELSDEEGARRVKSSLDAGTSWNRVEELSQSEGGYAVATPVATATATGTAFVVDCVELPVSCTFAVFDGADEPTNPFEGTYEITVTTVETGAYPPGRLLTTLCLVLGNGDLGRHIRLWR